MADGRARGRAIRRNCAPGQISGVAPRRIACHKGEESSAGRRHQAQCFLQWKEWEIRRDKDPVSFKATQDHDPPHLATSLRQRELGGDRPPRGALWGKIGIISDQGRPNMVSDSPNQSPRCLRIS